ncbi:MAG: cell envelope integrity protein TolA [Enterovirga sp.]|nr:cell envelope integrity protein TolA [Enterovirga sp.]
MRVSFNRSQPGPWISGAAHGAILLAAVFGLSSNTLPDANEGIPVEVMTENQFSEMTKGERQAAKPLPDPKPRADRVAETRVERDPGEAKVDAPAPPKRPAEVKVAEEETEAAAAAAAPPPPPAPKRLAEANPEPPPPAPPSRPEPPKPDPKVEAQKAADAKAAAAAKAAAEAKAVEAEKMAERLEAEALEKARVEAAKAKAEAEHRKQVADAKAKAEAEHRKQFAEAKAKAELDAKMKAIAEAEAREKAEAEAERRKELADAKAKAEADAKAKALAQAKAKADAEAKARKQAEAADKFSPGDIRQLLASKEPSQSSGATGREVQRTASLGTAAGNSQRLNPSQRDQLIGLLSEQLHRCWQVPIAAQSADKPPVPTVRVRLNQDGSLAGEPVVVNTSGDPLFRTVADSATRATRRCAPLRIPAQFAPFYNDWRELVVNFDPRQVG